MTVGGWGGTKTVSRATADLNGNSVAEDTWHWYSASSSSVTGEIRRLKSPSSSAPIIEYLREDADDGAVVRVIVTKRY